MINTENIEEDSTASSNSSYDKTLGEEFVLSFLNDKYILIDKIGVGSCSAVWLALNIKDTQLYAIKILHVDEYDSSEDEINILKEITSKNCKYLVNMVEYFSIKNPIFDEYNNLCIVMELYICSTYQLLKNEYPDGFNTAISNKIILDTLLGLKELNNLGYIHTDIKPENILIKGLNIIFAKLNIIIKNDTYVINLIQDIVNYEINKSSCSFFYTKTSEKKELLITLSKFLMNKFKLICNEHTTDEYQDTTDNIYLPNYYTKTFNSIIDCTPIELDYVLADFGLLKKVNGINNDEIQTRYYRSPEVLLGCNWYKNVDIWSISCVYYELLTNSVIFNPEATDEFSIDINHLIEISQFIKLDCEQYENTTCFSKIPNDIEIIYSIEDSIKCCKNDDIADDDLIFSSMFIKAGLSNPKDRLTLDELINMILNKN